MTRGIHAPAGPQTPGRRRRRPLGVPACPPRRAVSPPMAFRRVFPTDHHSVGHGYCRAPIGGRNAFDAAPRPERRNVPTLLDLGKRSPRGREQKYPAARLGVSTGKGVGNSRHGSTDRSASSYGYPPPSQPRTTWLYPIRARHRWFPRHSRAPWHLSFPRCSLGRGSSGNGKSRSKTGPSPSATQLAYNGEEAERGRHERRNRAQLYFGES